MSVLRLGLIGANIAASRSPALHVSAGRVCGLEVTYDLLVPADLGLDFDQTLDKCIAEGYRGVNVTYPYKERAFARLTHCDPSARAIGAVNTLILRAEHVNGYNTDNTGFVAAYCELFGSAEPGTVAVLGTGGVGKAIAFALMTLGVEWLRLHDSEQRKAVALSEVLRGEFPSRRVTVEPTLEALVAGVTGLVNCTPVGMSGRDGLPLPNELIKEVRWVFDAVYTPPETQLLSLARAGGLRVMSGERLFLHQGIDAFQLFTGRRVDPDLMRSMLCLVA